MIRISRITTPRATALAFALLAVAMLAFGALSAEEPVSNGGLADQSQSAQTEPTPCGEPTERLDTAARSAR